MRADQIKERSVYEVEIGKTPTGGVKKAVVKVVQWNPKTKSWLCKTESGKDMTIKDPKRFLNQRAAGPQKPSASPNSAPDGRLTARKGPMPKAKSVSKSDKVEVKVSKEEADRLLENVRQTARKVKVAEEAMESGLTINPKELQRLKQDAEDAKDAAEEAGVSLKSGGRSLGMMGGKEAAFRVLQEEGRPMRARELCDMAHAKGYCNMPGKTPWATIAAAIVTDINDKGDKSKFKKTGPGLFAVNENYKED